MPPFCIGARFQVCLRVYTPVCVCARVFEMRVRSREHALHPVSLLFSG